MKSNTQNIKVEKTVASCSRRTGFPLRQWFLTLLEELNPANFHSVNPSWLPVGSKNEFAIACVLKML